MALSRPPDVGEERVRKRGIRRPKVGVLVNRRTWKAAVGALGIALKFARLVARVMEHIG